MESNCFLQFLCFCVFFFASDFLKLFFTVIEDTKEEESFNKVTAIKRRKKVMRKTTNKVLNC